MAAASVAPRASGYQTASKAVVTKTEPSVPEGSVQNDKYYVKDIVPPEKMASLDNGLTETLQHQVSQSAGPHNAAPILCLHRIHTIPVQPVATTSQQWRGDSDTISCARVAFVQPGRCGKTIMSSIENEQHVEVLTQHHAGRLAVPGASAAAEVKVLMGSGSSPSAMSEELVRAMRRQPLMTQTALTQAIVGHARVVPLLGREWDTER